MMPLSSFSYDQVPYPNLSHSSTHPDCLATLAALAGMQPAPVENCRVLELGAASGGNLIPMAYALPGSDFTGIDLSGTQVREGQQKIQDLGLKNIRLLEMDILDLPDDFGPFDYIIAHGVFSWVPDPVREKLLEVYRNCLGPQGVGFISYNAYPGWHMLNIARDIMRYATRDITDPAQRTEAARSAIHFFAEADSTENDGYFGFLKMYTRSIEGLADTPRKYDSALLHDELEEINQPFYLHQFVDRAQRHDLQYLGDLMEIKGDSIPPDTLQALRKRSKTLVELEQNCDFYLHKTFRRTLVCQKEVQLNRNVTPSKLKNFFLASQARPVSEVPNIHERCTESFRGLDGAVLSIDHPLGKAAMLCLAEAWPRPLSFETLFTLAQARLVKENGMGQAELGNSAVDVQVLAANLFKGHAYSHSLVELHRYCPQLASRVAAFPVASRVARYEAKRQGIITNLRHERVELTGMEAFLVPLLDGTRDRAALVQEVLEGPLAQGTLTLEKDGTRVPEQEQGAALEKEIDHSLEWLALAGLLVEPGRLGE